MKKRKPNIANTLLKNSISALFCAIEIHNKPKIEYRYPNVVVILLNAWELALKSYIYKYQKNKKIVELTPEWRYIPLNKCINYVFVWEENLIYVSSIEKLYEYRNKIVHAFTSDLDEIMYSVIFQNIVLFWRFLNDFSKENLSKYDETLILLPIWFKKPFNPVDFLTNDSFLVDSSNDVKDFIKWLINTTEELYSKWIEESIFISYDVELLWKNKFKNADLLLWIDQKSPNTIKRETKLRLDNDISIQPHRELTDSEIRESFQIEYKDLIWKCKERYENFKLTSDYWWYYNEMKSEENKWYMWHYDTTEKKYRFRDNVFEVFDKYYQKNEII